MKLWIEMSRDVEHGGGDWSFTKCIWAPLYKKSNNREKTWLFWENIINSKTGDLVFHLRGKGAKAEFIGYSTIKDDGHKTAERPPIAGEWDYCSGFYRAFLTDFIRFDNPINLYKLFNKKELELKKYHSQRLKPKNLFYTVQSNRLQCLNGGYLSEANEDLLSIIFEVKNFSEEFFPIAESVSTSIAMRQIWDRVGQATFAANVKNNYNNQCCFPNCEISDENFLIASHIARWSDNVEKRGDTANGLCLCPVHDRAFEIGYFSLDDNYRICVDGKDNYSQVFKECISQYVGMKISKGRINPDKEALKEHRKRCNIKNC